MGAWATLVTVALADGSKRPDQRDAVRIATDALRSRASVGPRPGQVVVVRDDTGTHASLVGTDQEVGKTLEADPEAWRKYAPRGADLGVIEILLEGANARRLYDPNGIIMALADVPGELLAIRPVEGRRSEISGGPAVRYLTDRLDLSLTLDELAGLVGLELEPHEVEALARRHGPQQFEWHDDFYDPDDDWSPIQPRGLRRRFRAAAREA